jgi:hypothetical protein
MPHFESNPLEALALQPGEAEAQLDLRGLAPDAALAQVNRLLAESAANGPRSYELRFDPPRGDGAETLFLPLGRLLLQARRAGQLESCLPLADGAGYFIRLAR